MIYFTTGANGACKTLMTIWDVRQQQLKEPHRPVFYNGFEMVQKYADEFGWKPFDPRKWQDLPDGSICIMDECQNEFPKRGVRDAVPDYVNAVAQFRRKRGFDFWMIAPHPSLVDDFIRKLIASPSYHRHFKRIFGAEMSNELKFDAVDLKCEERNSGKRAQCTTRNFPKEAYAWYRSASLHTGKRQIPKQLYVFGACLLLVPAMIWGAFSMVTSNGKAAQDNASASSMAAPGALQRPMTTAEYVDSHNPRIGGFPHTAPRYDDITKPVVAPYPAACLVMAGECRCYSQQATRLVASNEVCREIAEKGFFVDWQQPMPASPQPERIASPASPAALPASRTVPVPASPPPLAQPVHSQGLVATNAQARAEVGGYGPRMAESVSVLGR